MTLRKIKFDSKKIALLSVLCAGALITFLIESLFPPFFIVGAKMGLSNIFTLFCLICFGFPYAIILVVVKCTLGSLLTGNLMTLAYSLSGGLVSLLVMSGLRLLMRDRVSIVAISVAGAVAHNVTQNILYCLIFQSKLMLTYLPYLVLLGSIAGVIVGIAVILTMRIIPKRLL